MIPAICERLNAIGSSSVRSVLTGGVVLGIDQDPAAKVTQILFDRGGQPRVVAKVARRPSAEQALRAEHRALEALWREPPAGVRDTIPEPLLLEDVGGRLVLATTALSGGPMSVDYYRPGHAGEPRLVHKDFELAGNWLAQFQRDTWRGQLVIGRETFEESVLPVFQRYRSTVGWSRWEQDLLDGLARGCAELSGVTVPLVAAHGDYALGNILLSEGQVTGVVDWELGQPLGLPLADLFKFVSSYGSFLDRAIPPRGGTLPGHPGWAAAARRWGGPGTWPNRVGLLHAYFGSGWFPDLVREFLRDHFERLGTAPEATALFLPLFLAEQAMVLDNPVYRAGYRSALEALWQDTDIRWARGLAGAR
jgi:Phosphotransferase enzyme family